MNCCLLLIALAAPRLAIVLLVVFTDRIGAAFDDAVLLPFAGFLFLPMTTLAYTLAQHRGGVHGLYLVLLALAVMYDVGVIGGSSRSAGGRGSFRRSKE